MDPGSGIVGELTLSHQSETATDFVNKQFWLFERGKMSALVEFIPVDEVLEPLLGPGSWHWHYLFREYAAAGRYLDFILTAK